MSVSSLLELCELAERHCPMVLLDLPHLTIPDRLGVLAWLRRLDRDRRPQ